MLTAYLTGHKRTAYVKTLGGSTLIRAKLIVSIVRRFPFAPSNYYLPAEIRQLNLHERIG